MDLHPVIVEEPEPEEEESEISPKLPPQSATAVTSDIKQPEPEGRDAHAEIIEPVQVHEHGDGLEEGTGTETEGETSENDEEKPRKRRKRRKKKVEEEGEPKVYFYRRTWPGLEVPNSVARKPPAGPMPPPLTPAELVDLELKEKAIKGCDRLYGKVPTKSFANLLRLKRDDFLDQATRIVNSRKRSLIWPPKIPSEHKFELTKNAIS